MQNYDDTICAIATALSPAGIGVIRVSGDNSLDIVSSIFVDKNKNKIDISTSHKIKYGYIYDDKKDILIDEVLCLTMLKPKSYTAEDVIEIQCHGGIVILKNILSLLVEKGARIAEPGEFTKRAFLNGRIDLSKAEAVSDIIMSKNNYAMRASFEQLKGNLSDKLNTFRNDLLESTAFIEACLDDPEHLSIEGFKPKLKLKCENIIDELEKIIKNYDNGRLIKEGINTVILGKPNVGKSSLLNTLLNEDRAIVTDIAGTTRDTIKESINLNGITLNIIDTAGIREEDSIDTVEKIGINRAKAEANTSDLIILMLDASRPLDANDNTLLSLCNTLNKKTIILLNKIDIAKSDWNDFTQTLNKDFYKTIIKFSTKDKTGLKELIGTIETMFITNDLDFNNEIFISNERQLQSIKKAKESLSNVLLSIDNEMPEDLLTIDLNDAYLHLSQVLGIEINDDLVNEIFSKFCMGK